MCEVSICVTPWLRLRRVKSQSFRASSNPASVVDFIKFDPRVSSIAE